MGRRIVGRTERKGLDSNHVLDDGSVDQERKLMKLSLRYVVGAHGKLF